MAGKGNMAGNSGRTQQALSATAPTFNPGKTTSSILDRLPQGHRLLLRGHFMDHTGNWCAYYLGTLKSYSNKNGYGFIECPPATQDWGADVFIHKQMVPTPWTLGQPVEFAVTLNSRGQPQATDVQWLRYFPDRQARSSMNAGGAQQLGQQVQPKAKAAAGGGYAAAPPAANMGGPAVAAAPQAEKEKPTMRLLGTLKSYSAAQGYGFLSSEYTTQKYSRDVYFDRSQLPSQGGYRIGQCAEFLLDFNQKGNPQARSINWDPVPMVPVINAGAPAGGGLLSDTTGGGDSGGGASVGGGTMELPAATLGRLQGLQSHLSQGKVEAAIVTAIDLQGPANDDPTKKDADYVVFVLDRLDVGLEAVGSMRNFVRMLLLLMIVKMFKRYVALKRCKQLATWFEALAQQLDSKNEEVKEHYASVVDQSTKQVADARLENSAFFADESVSKLVDAGVATLKSKLPSA
eukprot:TRINITY_DN1765_c0_g1_i2.p1 TRINITY_DN1765_c0_g1~~TRINITY_DN1765_c0_g1_i2.p1  ORF type:complete len:460 (+),score=91.90 TRINITY_DN1765_c0_g1_i2:161-1540(+)